MTAPAKINPRERRVLEVLAAALGDDCGFACLNFAGIGRRAKLDRKFVRRACRSLARKGLAEYHRGLWNWDGEPAGAGYCATKAGAELVKVTA